MMRQTSLVVTLLVAATAAPAPAQRDVVTAERRATIRRVLEITGAGQMALQAMEAMVPAQRTANPQIPAAFWDVFLARARRDMPRLVDSLVPVYAAHFTHAQMQELLRFYETPLGRHLIAVQPQIARTSMEVGQRWGSVIGQQVAESLSQAGVRPPQ